MLLTILFSVCLSLTSFKGYAQNVNVSLSVKGASLEQVMEDIALLWLIGVKVVLVHGGGPEINELMAKGISYDLCVSTLEESEIDFDENLKRLYEKISKGKTPSSWEEKKKLSDKLLRYGYSYDEVNVLFDDINFDF